MRSFTGLDIVFRLLNGTLSGENLEEALTTEADLYLGPWNEVLKARELNALLNSPTALAAMFASETAFAQLLDIAGAEMAASDSATELISNTSSAILTVVTNTSYLNLWQNVSENKTRLQARVNAGGSKLKRWNYTANGTWDIAALTSGLAAYSYFVCGEGGQGAASQSGSASGRGGSGAEAKWGQVTTGLPNTNQTITVGTGNTTIGALHTALQGNDATAGTGNNTGPGTTGGAAIYDADPQNAIWQANTGTKQGSYGGYGLPAASTGVAGGPGGPGLSGAGGTCAGSTFGGTGGTGLCSGGAGGGSDTGFGASPGGAATGYGTGGGGASLRGSDTASGGNPGGGLACLYGVAA
ncbi:hypothetical protein COW64_22990 [bacterium (Candidatus Blackallbacteria) CG18_big_fil_WC_8_21_14_2_50_49_26]|nr:MAG: hypothetical protein COW64_22990 [bacterium (Candidatus Blackallbacteria) CG18_big_fil_WC_8_21_14_2_50_49_26]